MTDAERASSAGPPGAPAPWGRPRRTAISWAVGLVALAAVVGVVLRLSELEEMLRLLHRVRPTWLLVALALQSATYGCAAGVWQVALASAGYRYTTRSLVPVALAMLFTNQAVPSGGLSGSAVVLRALGLRGVPESTAMAALLVGLLTSSGAYLMALAIGVAVLWALHLLNALLLVVAALFTLASLALPAGLVWYSRSASRPRVRERLARVPALGPTLTALASAPVDLLKDPVVLRRTITLQLTEVLLDAATLYVTLAALGVAVAPLGVFASFVMAYAVTRVAPTPLGLGTFEGTSIAMLHLVGVSIEAALAATLVFRAYTLWVPMLPGLWCMRLVLTEPPGSR